MRILRYFILIGALVALALAATPVAAQVIDDPVVSGSESPITTPTTVDVGGVTDERGAPVDVDVGDDVDVGGAVEQRGETEADTDVLALTGGDVAALLAIGAVAFGIGALLVVRARRSRPEGV